jgi:hypothetical protein
VANIINDGTLGGGFRHYNGLLPAVPGAGDSATRASVRMFHIPAANASAIFRGDIAIIPDADDVVANLGAGDLPQNISAPSASVVIGNGGGSGLGNAAIAPNIARFVVGDADSLIAGVVVGWGSITLYQAKNGFQYAPALTECWAWVETDPNVEMYITVPTVPGVTIANAIGGGATVQDNAPQQATRFGKSGLSINPGSIVAAQGTLPLKILSSGEQIGNDIAAVGSVAKVTFNKTRHMWGTGVRA